ncbi:MAG: lysophospholipase L1-like esterase [Verrucomicrobiales bacterium]
MGDSLTEFWLHTGRPIWELDFHQFKCINLGITADRAEDILFRVQRADFSRAQPDVFIVMAGTNNLGKEPPDAPEAVADGIMKIVQQLHLKCPNARILLLSILPSGRVPVSPLRQQIIATNQLLAVRAERKPMTCQFLNVHDIFIESDQRWVKGLTLDGTHLSLNVVELSSSGGIGVQAMGL